MKVPSIHSWENVTSQHRLNIVFENRNKQYGAYQIRQAYATHVVRSMALILFAMGASFLLVFRFNPHVTQKNTPVVSTAGPVFNYYFIPEPDPSLSAAKGEGKSGHNSGSELAGDMDGIPLPGNFSLGNIANHGIAGNATEMSDLPHNWQQDPERGKLKKTNTAPVFHSAVFPGGDSAFIQFVKSNFNFPQRCHDEGISGYVLLRFLVNEDGKISGISAVEHTESCPEFTEEAIRVLKISPRWIAAQNNGRFVKAWRQIPISLGFGGNF